MWALRIVDALIARGLGFPERGTLGFWISEGFWTSGMWEDAR